MTRMSHRSTTFFKFAGGMRHRRPVFVLATFLLILAVVIPGAVAQKSGDEPDRDLDQNRAAVPPLIAPVLADNNDQENTPQVFQQHTIELAQNCSLDPLRAFLENKLAAEQLKKTLVRVDDQLRIVIDEAHLRELAAVPCVAEIIPGWRNRPGPPPTGESKNSENRPGQTVAAAGTGAISGVVTAESTGSGVGGIDVSVQFYDGSGWPEADWATTGPDGQYTVSDLAGGAYRVLFRDFGAVYASEYYNNALSVWDAADVQVTEDYTTSGIDAALAEAGVVAGAVTAEADGTPLADVYVMPHLYDGFSWQSFPGEYTDAAGNYAVGDLWPGDYRVEYLDSSGNYVGEYYDNARDLEQATDIAIAPGSIAAGIDVALAAAGYITGTVTAETGGTPLEGVTVYGLNWYEGVGYWLTSATAQTDPGGEYGIAGLAEGDWRVVFQEPSGTYASEYYDGVYSLESAADIPVVSGAVITSTNASLATAGQISGSVEDESISPVQDLSAVALREEGEGSWSSLGLGPYYGNGRTDENGQYTIVGLPPGSYIVLFDQLVSDYAPEYYDDSWDIAHATELALLPGATIPNIDAILSEYGAISGTVTADLTGLPVAGVRVQSYRYYDNGWNYWGIPAETDGSGQYTLLDYWPGIYRISFADPNNNYSGEFYDDAPEIGSASDISVTSGSTTSAINAALAPFGHIAGTVTADDGGAPLQNIQVCALSFNGSDWEYVALCGYTGPNGSYDIGYLAAGVYRVEFYDYVGNFLGEYFDNAPDIYSATDIAVASGSTTAGIDAALAGAGFISGTITAAVGGAPLEDIEACLYTFDGSNWENAGVCDYTDENGDYTIAGLDSGVYRVQFYDHNDNYVGEYYDNVLNINDAGDIAVTAGSTTAGIDAALREYGHITGTVTADAGGTPLSGIEVCFYDFDGSFWYRGSCDGTNASGDYDIGVLTTGAYRVGFFDDSGGYAIEYYDNAPHISGAADVPVTEDSTTAGIDAALSAIVPAPPANDDINAARAAQPVPYQDSVDVRFATEAADDPAFPCGPADAGQGSVWYTVTPDQYSSFKANTFGSNYDTVLGVWRGVRGNLEAIACDDDTVGRQSQVKDTMLAGGETYFIEAAGYGSSLGELVLNIDLKPYTAIHDIALASGWNMISTHVEPDDPALETLLAGIESDMVLMKNGVGDVYWPAIPLNSIGGWDVHDGYQIFMNDPATLSISGPLVNPAQAAADLPAGWSLISYPLDTPAPVGQALSSISSQLILAKNGVGAVYWPAYGVDQIGEMQTGEGYQVYVDSAAVLTFTLPPPTAEFTADVQSGLVPLQVQFSDQSTGVPLSTWTWEFGDGSSSPEQNPSHIYDTPGVYTVSQTVTNSMGTDTETKSGYITVQAPNAWAFTATADTHVRSNYPDTNYGPTDNIRVKESTNDFHGYVKFDIQGNTGTIQQATLRFYATDASTDGGTVHVVNDSSWIEDVITWNNAPDMGQILGSAGAVALDQWVEIDVTSAVSSNGLVSFGITSGSNDLVVYSSKEGANAPQLYIVQQ